MILPPPISTLFPYTTLFRSIEVLLHDLSNPSHSLVVLENNVTGRNLRDGTTNLVIDLKKRLLAHEDKLNYELDRKSTRLNSSHANISYAVFCLKKKKTKQN